MFYLGGGLILKKLLFLCLSLYSSIVIYSSCDLQRQSYQDPNANIGFNAPESVNNALKREKEYNLIIKSICQSSVEKKELAIRNSVSDEQKLEKNKRLHNFQLEVLVNAEAINRNNIQLDFQYTYLALQEELDRKIILKKYDFDTSLLKISLLVHSFCKPIHRE